MNSEPWSELKAKFGLVQDASKKGSYLPCTALPNSIVEFTSSSFLFGLWPWQKELAQGPGLYLTFISLRWEAS